MRNNLRGHKTLESARLAFGTYTVKNISGRQVSPNIIVCEQQGNGSVAYYCRHVTNTQAYSNKCLYKGVVATFHSA